MHYQTFRLALILSVVVSTLILSACTRDGSDPAAAAEDGALGEPDRVNGRLMGELTLSGTVATGRPSPWARPCAQDFAENTLNPLCTLADDQGEYRMLGLFNQSGVLSTALTNARGNDQTLFSLYDLGNGLGGTASRANINPTTDVISRVYLFALQSRTGIDCFDEPACISSLAEGLDAQMLSDIEANLISLMGEAWPTSDYDPFTARYVADTDLDPLHQMHNRYYFHHDETDPGQPQLQVLTYDTRATCAAEVLAEISYSELASNPATLSIAGITSEEVLDAQACATLDRVPAPPFSLTVTADPTQGSAPLTANVRVTLTGAPENTLVTTSLINPLGQEEAMWTELERTVILTRAGVYRVIATAQAPNVEVNQDTQLVVDGSTLTADQATWGAAGSCYPAAESLSNFENICVEKLNGTITTPVKTDTHCSVLNEHPGLTFNIGICSTTQQHNESVLGGCTYLEKETRVLYYRNSGPGREAETAREQHDRNQRVCELGSGDWESLLTP